MYIGGAASRRIQGFNIYAAAYSVYFRGGARSQKVTPIFVHISTSYECHMYNIYALDVCVGYIYTHMFTTY